MKKLMTMLLLMVIAFHASAEGYSVVFSEENPLPDVFEKASPAVVVLALTTTEWDEKTGHVETYDEGGGSAVYIREGGYFLTNYHVVEDADELEIRTQDGTTYEAFVVGFDEATDVAVVQIEEDFPAEPIRVGSSSALRVGELICAIGTPVDEKAMYNTFTCGIVSGLDRNDADYESTRAVDLIQIDAAINPGNSGGALLNAKGELVGIPYMKYMGYYYKDANGEEFVVYEGLAFAIPIDVAMPIADAIIEHGVYNRPRFGVSVVDNNGPEEMLKNYPPKGLMVVEVEKNGSGARAGLRVNDVITHVNGERIYTFREYTKFVDKLAAGEAFEITVARYDDENGEKLKKPVEVTLTVVLEMID